MKRRLASFAAVLLLATPTFAQRDKGIYIEPTTPSQRDLERLNLELAWKSHLPVEGRADAVAFIQIIDNQIYAQTLSNFLIALNETTGEELWRMKMPKTYVPVFPVAANRDLVMVVNGPRLYILDRKSGKLKYKAELPSTVAGGLTADIHQCFIVLSNNRLISVGLLPEDIQKGLRVRLKIAPPELPTGISTAPESAGEPTGLKNPTPSMAILHTLRPPYKTITNDMSPSLAISETLMRPHVLEKGLNSPSIQMINSMRTLAQDTEINSDDKPRILWELQANRRMDEAPLMFGEFLIVAGTDRSVFVCGKHAMYQNKIRHEYLADAALSAPVAQYGPELYFCVGDGNVYWVNVESFRNNDAPVKHIKRYLAAQAIDRKPVITDDSIFLSGSQAGLTRVARRSFEKVWTNPEADRLYAVNPNVVYAGDRKGNLLVLDRARGLKLASLDIRTLTFPVVNERDDRLFLASTNGMLLCLHDRAFRRPDMLRKKEPAPPIDPYEDPLLLDPMPKKDAGPKKDAEPKKDPEPKKEADPKKDPDAKKDAEPKKEPDPKAN